MDSVQSGRRRFYGGKKMLKTATPPAHLFRFLNSADFLTQEGYFIAYKSSPTWDPPPPPAWGRGSKQEYYWQLLCLARYK